MQLTTLEPLSPVLHLIVDILKKDHPHALLTLNRASYESVLPRLYRHIVLDGHRFARWMRSSPLFAFLEFDDDEQLERVQARRERAFDLVESIHILDLDLDDTEELVRDLEWIRALGVMDEEGHLFDNLTTVRYGQQVIDRLWPAYPNGEAHPAAPLKVLQLLKPSRTVIVVWPTRGENNDDGTTVFNRMNSASRREQLVSTTEHLVRRWEFDELIFEIPLYKIHTAPIDVLDSFTHPSFTVIYKLETTAGTSTRDILDVLWRHHQVDGRTGFIIPARDDWEEEMDVANDRLEGWSEENKDRFAKKIRFRDV